jgi:hypothetical protein
MSDMTSMSKNLLIWCLEAPPKPKLVLVKPNTITALKLCCLAVQDSADVRESQRKVVLMFEG